MTPSRPTAAIPHADNLLGVCHAVGEALRVDPLLVRLAFALCFILKFELALIAYAICAAALLFERLVAWAIPARRPIAKAG